MEVIPVIVGSQGGTWWTIEDQEFLLHGAVTLNIQRDTHKSWGQHAKH